MPQSIQNIVSCFGYDLKNISMDSREKEKLICRKKKKKKEENTFWIYETKKNPPYKKRITACLFVCARARVYMNVCKNA